MPCWPRDDPALQLGGMLGDFVRGTPDPALPGGVIAGIRLHRAIDVYTDAHPQVLAAKALLQPPYRRYAGILLDMWFDHCLARDFARWSELPLERVLRLACVPCCRRMMSLLPPALQRFLALHAGARPAGRLRAARRAGACARGHRPAAAARQPAGHGAAGAVRAGVGRCRRISRRSFRTCAHSPRQWIAVTERAAGAIGKAAGADLPAPTPRSRRRRGLHEKRRPVGGVWAVACWGGPTWPGR